MESFIRILDYYSAGTLLIFLIGMIALVFRLGYTFINRPFRWGRAKNALDNPTELGFWGALRKMWRFSLRRFGYKANPLHVMGYILYHIGIITEFCLYGVSSCIVLYAVAKGQQIPDISKGMPLSNNYSLSNILANIFGNGEMLQARFLWGEYANLFITLTWPIVLSACIGMSLLVSRHWLRRAGAVVKAIDPAATHCRVKSLFSRANCFITINIYCIIWTEILSRLDIIHGMVYLHCYLGATLLLFFPYSYLSHIFLFPISLFYSGKRWQEKFIA